MSKLALIAAGVLVVATGFISLRLTSEAEMPPIEVLPKSTRELAAAIQGKASKEVRAAIIQKFGPPQRDIGSGVRIEQWDLEGGVLTFHPGSGPTFKYKKADRRYRLIETHNKAGENVLTDYEMTTLPDPKNHGSRSWAGNLKFEAGGRYQFVESSLRPYKEEEKRKVFFLTHPAGTVEVRYKAPVTADTLLESLPENTVVAELVFTSEKDKSAETYFITSSEQSRTLTFGGEKPLLFMMDAGWRNFWK